MVWPPPPRTRPSPYIIPGYRGPGYGMRIGNRERKRMTRTHVGIQRNSIVMVMNDCQGKRVVRPQRDMDERMGDTAWIDEPCPPVEPFMSQWQELMDSVRTTDWHLPRKVQGRRNEENRKSNAENWERAYPALVEATLTKKVRMAYVPYTRK